MSQKMYEYTTSLEDHRLRVFAVDLIKYCPFCDLADVRLGRKAPPPVGFAIVAMVMVFISYAFGRRYKPASQKQARISGLVWSGMIIAFMLVTAVANGTQEIFSNWGMYLILIAPAVGPMFVSVKKTDIGNSLPTI